MTLVLHAGFQKTATTTLQDCVFSRHSGIVNLGKPDFYGDTNWRRALGHLISAKEAGYRRDWCHGIIHAVTDGLDGAGKVAILSHEGLTNIYQNPPALIASRLRDAFGEVRVLLTVREQLAFIQSLYLHYVSYGLFHGTARPFEDWLEFDETLDIRSVIRHVDFTATIDKYVELFGRDRVYVLPFELFIHDRAAFALQLARMLELEPEETAALLAGATNRKERTSVRAYRFAVMNGTVVPAWVRSLCHRGMPGIVKRAVESWLRGGNRVFLSYPAGKAADLRQRYRAGNRRMAAEFGLDLASYEYAL